MISNLCAYKNAVLDVTHQKLAIGNALFGTRVAPLEIGELVREKFAVKSIADLRCYTLREQSHWKCSTEKCNFTKSIVHTIEETAA
jgi:hypothetical protein